MERGAGAKTGSQAALAPPLWQGVCPDVEMRSSDGPQLCPGGRAASILRFDGTGSLNTHCLHLLASFQKVGSVLLTDSTPCRRLLRNLRLLYRGRHAIC